MTTGTFEARKYRDLLEHVLSTELKNQASKFAAHKIRGLAIDCHPWHQVVELCICTELDNEVVEKYGKWCLADWKYFQFTRTSEGDEWPATRDTCQEMFDYCENNLPEDDPKEYGRRTDLMFRICAQALAGGSVKNALQGYNLAEDFELFVRHPDKPDANYCEIEASQPSF